tara:strand:+ start:255 stop:671 length:417 start_codon:yes stop_codon:yes gene_type:complete
METVELIEGMDYPEAIPEPSSPAHQITVEIIVRLQQLDETVQGDESLPPGGIRLINRLAAIARKNRRAYRLLLDMIGDRRSFSESLEKLASRHVNSDGVSTTRQSWLQNAQADVEMIEMFWPEIGKVMSEILKRRVKE